MPKIGDAFKTITISLPSYKDSQVVLKTNFTVDDISESEDYEKEFDKGICLALKSIRSWNFQDESGADLPITIENLKQFPAQDFQLILETVTPFIQKKRLSGKTK